MTVYPFICNPFAQVRGGVEPRLIQFLVKNQVTHLISPRISSYIDSTLLAAGILVFVGEGSGSVSSALERFKPGKLTLIAEKLHAS